MKRTQSAKTPKAGKNILKVDPADDFSERNSDTICCKNRPPDRVAQRRRRPLVFTRKSGAGRRLLRAQLRHYLRVKGFASRGFRS
jgi:hypothetical protein